MRRSRQLHLWIGLFTSVLILIEAVTGIILNEPWLIGGNNIQAEHRISFERSQAPENVLGNGENVKLDSSKEGRDFPAEGRNFRNAEMKSGSLGLIKGLHAGRIGNTDVTLLMNLTAIGLIILTITGIVLSIKILKVEVLKRKMVNGGS